MAQTLALALVGIVLQSSKRMSVTTVNAQLVSLIVQEKPVGRMDVEGHVDLAPTAHSILVPQAGFVFVLQTVPRNIVEMMGVGEAVESVRPLSLPEISALMGFVSASQAV